MRYDNYKKKIFAIANVIAFIKRHRVLFASIFLSILTITFALMGTSGMIISDTGCPEQLTYGDNNPIKAVAFLSNVSYEHTEAQQDEWKEGLPSLVGEYKVRAVSVNGFGIKTYGKVHVVKVLPKSVTLSVGDSQMVYGEKPSVICPDLVNGDVIADYKVSYEGLGNETVTAIPDNNTVKITRGEGGEDVTTSYNLGVENKELSVLKRDVSIKLNDAEKIYDGTPLTCFDYTYLQGNLVDGDEMTLDFLSSITRAGTVSNRASVNTILTANGVDVTSYYSVNVQAGELKVTKRKVTIHTYDKQKTYDGSPLIFDDYKVDEYTPLVDGEDISYINTTITDAGKIYIKNNTECIVTNANGETVTSNYEFNFAEDSTLTVNKIKLTIKSFGGEKVYDGEEYFVHDYQLLSGELVGGESLTITYNTKRTNVGVEDNDFNVQILKGDGETDSTSNYSITKEKGVISILKRKIIINTQTLAWVYDGNYHSDEKVYDNQDLSYDEISSYPLVLGHELSKLNSAKILDVNSQPFKNEISFAVIGDEGDVSENYQIEYNYGELSISPRPIKITSLDASKIYNGIELVREESSLYCDIGLEVIPYIDELVIDYTAEAINAGEYDNSFEYKVLRIDGDEDVTFNYAVTTEFGKLTVGKRHLSLIAMGASREYDGSYLTQPEFTGVLNSLSDGYSAVPEWQTLTLSMTEDSKILDVGTQSNVIESSSVKVVDGEDDVTDNYVIDEYVNGVLEVTQREVAIKPIDVKKIYNALEIKNENNEYEVVSGSIVNGEELIVTCVGSKINVWDVTDYKIDSWSVFRQNEQINRNYDISCEEGTITVIPRSVTVTTPDDEWEYDGEYHSNTSFVVEESLNSDRGLISWHTAKLVQYSETVLLDAVEKATNYLMVEIFDESFNVTENYDIEYSYGHLTIHPRKIYITTLGDSKVYDDTALTKNEYTISHHKGEKPIVDIDEFTIFITGSITDCGEAENDFIYTITRYGEDVSNNYEVTSVKGDLIVTKRPVTITTRSESFIYNGRYNSFAEYDVVGGSFVSGHSRTPVEYAEIKDVGSVANKMKIMVENGYKDVSNNYEITIKNEGMLTVEKRKITATADSLDSVYNGDEQTCQSLVLSWTDENKVVEGEYPLANWHYYEAEYSGKTTRPDEVVNKITKFVIYDEQNEDVSDNYDVTFVDGTLKITKLAVTLKPEDLSVIYNGEEHLPDKVVATDGTYLAYGDIATAEFSGAKILPGQYYSTIVENSLVIKDGDDDVTDCYEITLKEGVITIIAKITITANSDEKIYDGTPLKNSGFTYDGYLIDGHEVKAVVAGEITSAGTLPNVITDYYVLDENGERSQLYQIEIIEGFLTVNKRPIEIITESHSKTYDGTVLTNPQKTVISKVQGENAVASGDELYVEVVGSILDYGTVENDFIYYVLRGEIDVTDNYDVTKTYGTLEITKRAITVKTGTQSFVYNGEHLFSEEVTCVGGTAVVKGENLLADVKATIRNVGDKVNDTTAKIIREDENVTKNYEITYQKGTLTVTKRDIVLKAVGANKLYDGEALTSNKVEPINGTSLGNGDIAVAEVDGSQTEVGYSTCSIKSVKIYYGTEDVTYCYNLLADQFEDGELLVQIPITISSSSATKVYDGTPLTKELYTLKGEISQGHELHIEWKNSVTNVGKKYNEFEWYIVDEDGSDVSRCYKVTPKYGILIVKQRVVNYSTGSAYKEYDGEVLINSEVEFEEATDTTGLIEGHEISFVTTGIYQTGTADNVLEDVNVTFNGVNVTSNYKFNCVNKGKLRIYQIITIKPVDVIKRFINEDTIVYAENEVEGVGESAVTLIEHLDDGYYYYVKVEGELQGNSNQESRAESYITEFRFYNKDGKLIYDKKNSIEENVGGFEFAFEPGEIKIMHDLIIISIYEITAVYDGQELSYNIDEWYVEDCPEYIDRSRIEFNLQGKIETPGTLNVEDIDKSSFKAYDNYGNLLVEGEDYNVIFTGGPLTMKRMKITIATPSLTVKYDGEEHSTNDESVWVSQGKLINGHKIDDVLFGKFTNVGSYDNRIIGHIKIVDSLGNDVTDCYNISYVYGKVTITS